MPSLHKCTNCGFDKHEKFLTNYDKETGIETMICPKCLTTGHPSLFVFDKTKEEVKLKPKNNYPKQKKIDAKTNLEFKIFFGFLTVVIMTSSVMSAISNHYDSKSIQYRNSIIKPETESTYQSETTDSNCNDEALREFEDNHGSTVDNEDELNSMRFIILKHCGY